MDIADRIRPGQGEEVAIVQQILGGILEALSADVPLGQAVGADRRAHRPINDGDTALEDLLKRMFGGRGHLRAFALALPLSAVARSSYYNETINLLPYRM
jgi:hypothetical protein